MTRLLISLVTLAALCIPVAAETGASPGFRDVPSDHWAADAVEQMSDSGIVVGYPDGKYRGEKPVTRYELAVTLERFVHFVEASRAPLVKEDKKLAPRAKPPSDTPPKSESAKPTSIEAQAKTSIGFLISNAFVSKDTLLAKDGAKPIDTELLAQSLTSVVAQLVVLEADRQKQSDSVAHEQPQQ